MGRCIKQIFNKGKQEDCSEQDRQEMYAVFHVPEKEYEVKTLLLDDLSSVKFDSSKSDFEDRFEDLWEIIETDNLQQGLKIRVLNKIIKIAAVLFIGVIIGLYAASLEGNPDAPVFYSAYSLKGSVSEVMLPDSTIIYLNTDSRIRYSVGAENGVREVFLNGEAWFEVKKNVEKPFIVYTKLYNINVTGTKFNVKAYDREGEIITTLEEGEVILKSSESSEIEREVVLVPGEQAVLSENSNKFSVKNVHTELYSSWRTRKLVFENTGLKELITMLEQRYGVDIVVKNTEIMDLHFDGTFENKSIEDILEILKNTLPISYSIVDQKIEIN